MVLIIYVMDVRHNRAQIPLSKQYYASNNYIGLKCELPNCLYVCVCGCVCVCVSVMLNY